MPGEGEVALALVRKADETVTLPQEVVATKISATEYAVKVKIDGKEADLKVKVADGDTSISEIIGNEPNEAAELLNYAEDFIMDKVLFGLKINTTTKNFTLTFENATSVVDPTRAVVGVEFGTQKLKLKPKVVGNDLVVSVDLSNRAEDVGALLTAVLGEEAYTPTAQTSTGGGGGGCSVGAPQSASSGLLNLGVLLSGLLGLFGFRRKKH